MTCNLYVRSLTKLELWFIIKMWYILLGIRYMLNLAVTGYRKIQGNVLNFFSRLEGIDNTWLLYV